ncbi:MAG TPA: Hsp20 family protein [Chthoniobacterales bacterium]
MNSKITRYCLVSAVALTLSAPHFLSAATSSPSATVSPPPAFSPPPLGQTNHFSPTNLDQRMGQLDNQLDSVFANTFRNFGDWFGPNNLGSSIDLRDQKDKYVVRVYVPGSDTSKVNARVENNTLHVTAEGGKTRKNSSQSERYEQIVSLPGPVDASKMRIERKQNLVVINLPKAVGATAAASPTASPETSPFENNFAAFDQSIVNQMARMQSRMDQMFRDAFPDENGLTNDFGTMPLGSAVHVDNQKNQYVVHFYLPNKDLKNIDVKLENGQLRLTASESENEQKKTCAASNPAATSSS